MSPDPRPWLDDEAEEEFYDGPEPAELPAELPADAPELQLFQRFSGAILRKRELERELKAIDKEIAQLTPLISNFFAAYPEFCPMTVGNLTVFKRSQIYAKAREDSSRQEVCDALRATGLGHFVYDTFNSNRLSGWVRELERNQPGTVFDAGELLPPDLARVLDVSPKVRIVGQRKRPKLR